MFRVNDSVAIHDTILNMIRVYQGLPETRGVSETGYTGTGTVVHFGTPQHTAYPYRGVAGMHGLYLPKLSLYL